MDHEPLISVIIPTFNRALQTIAAAESVLAQTYPCLEIIIIDDGSTDGSSDTIRTFVEKSARTNERFRTVQYFRQLNQGSSAARNHGIAKASGEYIAFLDSDDVWYREKLELQMRAIEQFGNVCGACVTDVQLVSCTGMNLTSFLSFGRRYDQAVGIDPDPTRVLARSFGGYWISSLLARADLIRLIGGFDHRVSYCEDRDFYFNLSLVTSFAYIDKPLLCSDRSPTPPGSNCRPWDRAEVRLREEQRMYEKWLNLDGALPADVRRIVIQGLRSVHCGWANWHLEHGRYEKAREALSAAAKCELTPEVMMKWTLTSIAPAIAKKLSPKTRPYL